MRRSAAEVVAVDFRDTIVPLGSFWKHISFGEDVVKFRHCRLKLAEVAHNTKWDKPARYALSCPLPHEREVRFWERGQSAIFVYKVLPNKG